MPGKRGSKDEGRGDLDTQELDEMLDEANKQSFPASDPPAITQPRKKKRPQPDDRSR